MPKVSVIGLQADGQMDLAARPLLETAEVVIGGERHLSLVPQISGQIRELWPSPLRANLPAMLAKHQGRRIAVLASGDPLLHGIGSTLIELLGSESVDVIPTLSSVTLASARMNWPMHETAVVNLVGRDVRCLSRHLSPGQRLIALSSSGRTPAEIAQLLTRSGYGLSEMTVLAELGTSTETRHDQIAKDFDAFTSALNVVAIKCWGTPLYLPSRTSGLPDEAFETDGQLTKRDIRASALARLAPLPGQLLWDVGAGAGSVGIEWARADVTCQAIAIEANIGRAATIVRNSLALGVPELSVVTGHAPAALAGLPRPNAVFVGGGATEPGVLQTCWEALANGGRMVAHAVTIESESVIIKWYRELGGELTRLQVEHVDSLGRFTGWKPSRAVVQWAIIKGTAS